MYEERVKFVEYKGKSILYLDCSNLQFDQVKEVLAEFDKVVRKQPLGSLLCCGNYENMHFSVNTLAEFNKYIPEHQKYIKRNTMVGITGLIKVMADAASKFLRSPFRICKTKEEAFDWLVSL